MATKDEDFPMSTSGDFDITYFFGNTPYPSRQVNPWEIGSTNRRSTQTPNYFDLAGKGRLPENYFSFTKSYVSYFKGYHNWTAEGLGVNQSGVFPASFCTPPSLLDSDIPSEFNQDNLVKLKTLEKVKQQSVNLAVSAAESDQVLKMIGTNISRIGKAFSCARSGNWKGAAAALGVKLKGSQKSLAAGWLELQYGWVPLLSDIHGGMEELQRRRGKGEYRTFKTKKSFTRQTVSRSENQGLTDTTSRIYTYTSICVMKMQRSDPTFQTLSALGITNPLLVLWEKTPFSFVVDWLIPVGTFLGQFDASVGWTLVTASVTRITDRSSTLQRNASGLGAGMKTQLCSGFSTTKHFSLTRVPTSDITDLWTVPYVKDPASLMHALNALALLTSLKR